MQRFFLKFEEKKNVVREWIENDSGFMGRASDQDRASLPILYAKFRAAIEELGEEEAFRLAREVGEWAPKREPRPVRALERAIEGAEMDLDALREELEEAKTLLVEEEEPEPAPKKKKKTSKKKSVSKQTEEEE